MKRWLHRKEMTVQASYEFWNWYDNLNDGAKVAVDNIARLMKLPSYLECSDDDLDKLYCFYATQQRAAKRRFMPLCAGTIAGSIDTLEEAEELLAEFEKEKVIFVNKFRNELSKNMFNNLEAYMSGDFSSAKLERDYLSKALDNGIMAKEEFYEILSLLDFIDIQWGSDL